MGWVIVLGILVLLAILPLGVSIRYNHAGPRVLLLAGPLRLQLIPGKKKDPQKKEKQPKKKEKSKQPEKSKEPVQEAGGSLSDFLPLVRIVLELLVDFRRKLRISRLELKLILAADDPCDLGVNYGRAWAALGNLWPHLERYFVIKKRDVEVECCFVSEETLVIARIDLTITLGRIVRLAVYYGIRALRSYWNIQNTRKGGKKA